MDYTLLDNSAALIAASEARHRGGSHELDDAERDLRRAREDAAAARAVYLLRPSGILGADLDRANRRVHVAARRVTALGGEV